MKIIVLIKQVPETTDVRIDPETNTLIREGVDSIINPFDMYAIEEALRVKERLEGAKVVVISMGPPQAVDALKEALSMGCDEAVLLSDRKFAGSDTWATSYTLAQAIKKIGDYRLIFCGKQASDGDTAQVGPGVSTHLDIPQVTYVKHIEQIDTHAAKVERMTEEGYDIIETPLPAVLTVVKEINEPRLPSLKGKMRAKKAEIPVWGAGDISCDEDKIGLDGSPTRVVKIFTPPPREGGRILTGEPDEVAKELAGLIKDIVTG
ncbi:MAG: electron transfer flavoprotein subunit beta/FixA family protein [Candidatus Omnitrophica bacterium]|nr:electron transfer flavoprotein subunit beta/FixA family protein [Candidatus Omnitrophota bacterium]MBU1128660.1 electron transfer flavoprotein subunit beta/FixA family protein [Candidatus Omnitrophota bacterium]MBU1656895.1 electron transfer flavoprotein subunit beta/FixA family protein [Candidatus Omnitrophota bacterium]MBU1783927.1 electron transfer flavoprotein subunit beta/FixA family protein [Candidatus Omnitrophota bacterium]MBU1852210.1 electron transfer flavoprotein subunit beta/FixA